MTKPERPTEILEKFLKTGSLSLVPTEKQEKRAAWRRANFPGSDDLLHSKTILGMNTPGPVTRAKYVLLYKNFAGWCKTKKFVLASDRDVDAAMAKRMSNMR